MGTKKILGLDIGTTSIGWAIVEASSHKKTNEYNYEVTTTDINNDRIGIYKDAVGVRIIPQNTDNLKSFNEGKKLNQGNTLTPTANRRKARGSRRMKSRYKLRRDKLTGVLDSLGMKPAGHARYNEQKKRWEYVTEEKGKWYTKSKDFEESKGKRERIKRPKDEHGNNDLGKQLYKLRTNAIQEKIDLEDWGRILLHFNQWRGYSSDRFTKEEKTTFDYYIAEIVEFDESKFTPIHDEKEKTRLKYNQYPIIVKTQESIDEGENGEIKLKSEFTGYIFLQKTDFKKGDFITIKKPEWKQNKKGKVVVEEYYKITTTTPDPTDWNYRYQTLNKSLSEWCEKDGTVGSYFYHNFYEAKNLDRIRNNIVNRDWYEKEFDKIWEVQYPLHKKQLESISIDDVLAKAFKDEDVRKEVKKQPTFEAQLKYLFKEKIIYFQRPWQQSKNKGECRFEKVKKIKTRTNKETGKEEKYKTYEGRTVIPRSHPLHQEYKIWEQINKVRLWAIEAGERTELFSNPSMFKIYVGQEIAIVKDLLYAELQKKKSQSWKSFVEKALKLEVRLEDEKQKKAKQSNSSIDAYFAVNFTKKNKKGEEQDNPLKGNTTKVALQNILIDKANDWFDEKHAVSNLQEVTNLQLLWELIYDITESDPKKVAKNLQKHFRDFSEDICTSLSVIRFDDSGMSNLSAKAIRKLLPLMKDGAEWEKSKTDIETLSNWKTSKDTKGKIHQLFDEINNENTKSKNDDTVLNNLKEFIPDYKTRKRLLQLNSIEKLKGLNFWEAAAVVYGQHSKQGIESRQMDESNILNRILPVKRGSMNNPIVEKIVNETLSTVKEIHRQYGFDEIRIELSRELKASKDEREQMWEGMNANSERNELAKRILRELFGKPSPSNNDIIKFKVYEDEAKQVNEERYNELELEQLKKDEEGNPFKYKKYEDAHKEFGLKEPRKADIIRYRLWLDQMCQCPYTGEIIKLSDVFTTSYEVEHIIPKERYYDNAYSNKVITSTKVNGIKGNRTAWEFINQDKGKEIIIIDGKQNQKVLHVLQPGTYEDLVKKLFPKGRKLANLLRKEISEDLIERQLKETQYINKKLKEELGKIKGTDKVWVTTGAVTDILRSSWHLDEVMKELVKSRYENFNIPLGSGKVPISEKLWYEKQVHNRKTDKDETVEVFPGFEKRLDHRHHALDAIIIACTKQWHIQYINTMNAANSSDINDESDRKKKSIWLKNEVCRKNEKGDYYSYKFTYPWQGYDKTKIPKILENVVISHKNTKQLTSPSKNNRIEKSNAISIRGEIHKSMLIGKRTIYKTIRLEEAMNRVFSLRKEYEESEEVINKNFEEVIREIGIIVKDGDEIIKIIQDVINKESKEPKLSALKKKVIQHCQSNKNELIYEVHINQVVPVKKDTDAKGTVDKVKITSVIDERTIRYIQYRRYWIEETKQKIERLNKKNKQCINLLKVLDANSSRKIKLEEIKARIESDFIPHWMECRKKAENYSIHPIFHNALYDVRLDKNDWIPLFKLDQDIFHKISYAKATRTKLVKDKIISILNSCNGDFQKAFTIESVLITNPIIVGQTPIPIKKPTLRNKTDGALYELIKRKDGKKSTWVELGNNFMVYVFEDESGNRTWKLLTFIDALNRKLDNSTLSIEKLFPTELMPSGFSQKFTLTHNDTVFINPKDGKGNYTKYSKEEIEGLFDWHNNGSIKTEEIERNKKLVVQNLWQVVRFSYTDTGNSINFMKMHTAHTISIPINEVNTAKIDDSKPTKIKIESMRNTYNTTDDSKKKNENKEITEVIDPYNKDLFENCIKVFTDKLGKKIVPYWKFPNGCWDNETAVKLNLIDY